MWRLLGDSGLELHIHRLMMGAAAGAVEELIVVTVTSAAFWTALAATIKAFIARYAKHKVVVIKEDGTRVEINGYSQAEVEVLLRALVNPDAISLDSGGSIEANKPLKLTKKRKAGDSKSADDRTAEE
jgi:membrane-associated two-gene conflict system component 1 (EACC1)